MSTLIACRPNDRRVKPAIAARLVAILGLVAGITPATHAQTLYVSNYGNNTIEKFTSGGVASVFASTGLNDPYGLAFDSSGNLFVANYGSNTIEKFSSAGTASVFASTGLSSPIGVAFDTSGNLYAGNLGNNTIEEFTSGGVASVFASTGLNSPTGLVFAPTGASAPEPTALLLFAPSALGLVAARRRKRVARTTDHADRGRHKCRR